MAGVTAFPFQRTITIDTTASAANIATSLTDFPVCVVVNSSSWTTQANRDHFFSSANTNGKRVQFYSGSTSLSYEVDQYDSANQKAVYWVKVPSIAGSATTSISVGYGADPNGADQSNGTATWSDQTLVWHLNDATTSTVSDSSTNAYTGTKTAAGTPAVSTGGYVADAQSFNGTSAYVKASVVQPSYASLSCWVKATAWSNTYQAPVAFADNGDGGPANSFALLVKSSGKMACYSMSSGDGTSATYISYDGTGTNTLATATWYHVAAVYSSGSIKGYVNGALDGSGTGTAGTLRNAGSTFTFAAGAQYITNSTIYTNRYVNGLIDEARLASVARSADWIKGEYWSMKTTSWPGDGWITYGTEAANARPYVLRRSQAVNRAAVF